VHVGEFLELIRRLAADEQGFLDDGAEEVAAMATGGTPVEPVAPPAAPMPDLNTTVGSLRELAKENG
jgi:hypothetical protein